MSRQLRSDIAITALATIAWAIFIYAGFLAATFWFVAPPVIFSVVSTIALCNVLECKRPLRPFVAMIPALVTLPYIWITWARADDNGLSLVAVKLLAYPALLIAAIYFAYTVSKRHEA